MRIILVIFYLSCGLAYSQDLVIKSFVTEDSVQLRWAPRNYQDFVHGLKLGYQINIRYSDGTTQTETVAPLDDREQNGLNGRSYDIQNLLRSIDNQKLDRSAGSEMVYAMLMIAAGPEKNVAKLCGLYYALKLDRQCQIQLAIDSKELKSEWLSIDPDSISTFAEMSELVGHKPQKREAAYIEWEAETLKAEYSGYWIEKSEDGQFFKRMNEIPYTFLKNQIEEHKTKADFLDTLVREGETYFYRVRGINHFGDVGKVSNVVQIYIPRFLKGECRIDTVFAEEHKRNVLGRFLFNNDSDIGNLKEFVLYRSDSMFFGYKEIGSTLPDKNGFSFETRSELHSGDKNYYKVAAISQDQDTAWSYPHYFFTLDQIPPDKPSGLIGEINDSGVVSLSWLPNPENDIRGYRVFMANSLKEEFVEITRVFEDDTTYNDTLPLNTLTSDVYFRIAAVDLNYNNSIFSEIVKLQKPDTIPPVPAVIKSYSQSDSGIALTWINSTSKDVSKCRLIRRFDGEVIEVFNWTSDSIVSHIDSFDLEVGRQIYSIVSLDESGNFSSSKDLAINYEPGFRTGLDSLSATVNREERYIQLRWELPEGDIYSIQVFRKKGSEKYRLVRTIREEKDSGFIDRNLSINNRYTYKVRVTYKSGLSSRMGEPLEVVY